MKTEWTIRGPKIAAASNAMTCRRKSHSWNRGRTSIAARSTNGEREKKPKSSVGSGPEPRARPGLVRRIRAAEEQKQLNTNLLDQVNSELDRLRQQQTTTLDQIEKEYQHEHIGQSHDLLAQYEALHSVERQHPEAARMTWGITILLILIEVFPALVKLMLPYTAYSALVEAREREDIQRAHSMANHNITELVKDPEDSTLFVMQQTASTQQAANVGGDR